ncbi:ganglioside GM2 activator [Ctenopharyngodon idella]|uniref:ganglioside GM2 activator n=1 Tax=Ctenopharyngodon idella TaxID=7959 RepID=UPI00222E75CD|nr:ganglioside GM2 activator [Ctenopharyngodon idella]
MKKSCISVFIVLFSANCFLLEVSSQFRKFKGFSWESCGKPDDPIHVKTLHVYPNPIPSPGYVLAPASATTLIDLLSPLPVNVTLEKEVAGAWVKIPCVYDQGSCYYPDACDRLVQVFMTYTGFCPDSLGPSSLSCGCPLKAGDYIWPTSGIYIPNFSLPDKLTNFRLQIILGNSEKELGCLKVNFSVASGLLNQHNEM